MARKESMIQTHMNWGARGLVAALAGTLLGLAACALAVTPATSITTQPTSAPAVTAPTTASQVASPVSDCRNGITPSQTEGPYYKADTPERASLLQPGMTGTKTVLTGYVLTRDCKPIANASLDFWQANDQGGYDNSGYTLRGYQLTDASGRYRLETILPGLYPGRTRHIHVKVQAPNQPVLTTQLYFPEEQHNSADSIYDPKLLVTWQTTSNEKIALYNFVLNVN